MFFVGVAHSRFVRRSSPPSPRRARARAERRLHLYSYTLSHVDKSEVRPTDTSFTSVLTKRNVKDRSISVEKSARFRSESAKPTLRSLNRPTVKTNAFREVARAHDDKQQESFSSPQRVVVWKCTIGSLFEIATLRKKRHKLSLSSSCMKSLKAPNKREIRAARRTTDREILRVRD